MDTPLFSCSVQPLACVCSRMHVAALPALNAREVAPAPPRACTGAQPALCAHSHPRPLQPRVACPAPCQHGCPRGACGCHIESVRPNTTNRKYQPLHTVCSHAGLRPTTAAVASSAPPLPTLRRGRRSMITMFLVAPYPPAPPKSRSVTNCNLLAHDTRAVTVNYDAS